MHWTDTISYENKIKTGVYNAVNPLIWTKKVDTKNAYADENVDVDMLRLIISTLNDVAGDCETLLRRVVSNK